MSKFVCENESCERFGIIDEYTKESYILKDGKLVGEHSECPKCGKTRREINPNSDVPLSKKNIQYQKFNSSSKEEKTEALKKRSHEHYLKKIKPYKEDKLHETMKAFKDMNK